MSIHRNPEVMGQQQLNRQANEIHVENQNIEQHENNIIMQDQDQQQILQNNQQLRPGEVKRTVGLDKFSAIQDFKKEVRSKSKRQILREERESGLSKTERYQKYGIAFDLAHCTVNASDSPRMVRLKRALKNYLEVKEEVLRRAGVLADNETKKNSKGTAIKYIHNNDADSDDADIREFNRQGTLANGLGMESDGMMREAYQTLYDALCKYTAGRSRHLKIGRGRQRLRQVLIVKDMLYADNRRYHLSGLRHDTENSLDKSESELYGVFPNYLSMLHQDDYIDKREADLNARDANKFYHWRWWVAGAKNNVNRLIKLYEFAGGTAFRAAAIPAFVAGNALELAGKVAKLGMKALSGIVNLPFMLAGSERRWHIPMSTETMKRGWTSINDARRFNVKVIKWGFGTVALPLEAVFEGFRGAYDGIKSLFTGEFTKRKRFSMFKKFFKPDIKQLFSKYGSNIKNFFGYTKYKNTQLEDAEGEYYHGKKVADEDEEEEVEVKKDQEKNDQEKVQKDENEIPDFIMEMTLDQIKAERRRIDRKLHQGGENAKMTDEEAKNYKHYLKREMDLETEARMNQNGDEEMDTLKDALKNDAATAQQNIDNAYQQLEAQFLANPYLKVTTQNAQGRRIEIKLMELKDDQIEGDYIKIDNPNPPIFEEGQPSMDDCIQKGAVNTCYFMSTLAAIVKTNPNYITNTLIKDSENREGFAVVHLYDAEGAPCDITVSKSSKFVEGIPLWVQLVEKAALTLLGKAVFPDEDGNMVEMDNAAYRGGLDGKFFDADTKVRYNELSMGTEDLAVTLLLGKNGKNISTRDPHVDNKYIHDAGDTALGQALCYAAHGKMVTASTCTNDGSAKYDYREDKVRFPQDGNLYPELEPGHTHLILGEGKLIDGQRSVRIRDPRGEKGEKGVFDIPFGVFKTCFSNIYVSGIE